ncbi:hypothetical protein AKJ36_02315 [candidate division MSBL1 archaeon SCGC-AAA259I07]|uniref:acetate--CoA ligase (ADP-forming) n=1 Tax=candidate division MSBL1 archaeon SCGC-AAA259I07 TaxID=1698266 RepID=A0A133UKM7_9EURY|nr:hypothetical protein AKJ36_02315 [candidate division MSBL1 archaeon SCGC-AAA259I07]
MPAKNLDKIFKPKNIALIGADGNKGSLGFTLFDNLIDWSSGEVFPVNPDEDTILDTETFPDVKEIPESVDLGIITTPASTVSEIVENCGEAGIPGLIIISSGFSETGKQGEELEREIDKIRQTYGMRILGPNTLGVKNPSIGLNASCTEQMPEPGEITFIYQGAALASATLDWAITAHFGFSSFVSLGNMLDVDFADLIDYFGRDPKTRSIFMYLESITDAERFMSAARSFARTKPIMAVKAGKHIDSAENHKTLAGSLATSDEVYDAAFKRAGITRVDTIEELFNCFETLAKQNLPGGPRLAISANSDDSGKIATDALVDQEGVLASFSENTTEELEELLSQSASVENPVNVTREATPSQYKRTCEICLDDENVDGLLCIYTPLGDLEPKGTAEAIIGLKEKAQKPILPCWMGGEKVEEARKILRQNGYSVQSAPELSIKAYLYLNRYARNIERLLETPEELPIDRTPPKHNLKPMLRKIANENRNILTEQESMKIIETYGIPTPETRLATSPQEAAKYGSRIGFPVSMKVQSSGISKKRKKEVGGIVSNLNSKEETSDAYEKLVERVQENCPSAEIDGVIIQEMVVDREIELIMGSRKDPIFKTSLIFGKGGSDATYYRDIEVGFPPLNQTLARRLIEDTKVYNHIKESEGDSDVLIRKLEEHLVRLSQLLIDFPEIEELEINPIVKTEDKFIAMDPEIVIDNDVVQQKHEAYEHLVIEPYPRKYVEDWSLKDGREVLLRPIRPEDEPLEFELFDTFSKETWRHRFFGSMKDVTHEDMVRFTNIDYRREMAIIGLLEEDDKRKMIGVGRLIINPDGDSGEFAVVVGDPWQGLGLGEKLVDSIIGVAEDKNLDYIGGTVKKENTSMINLCKKLGFEIENENGTVKAVLKLRWR